MLPFPGTAMGPGRALKLGLGPSSSAGGAALHLEPQRHLWVLTELMCAWPEQGREIKYAAK